MYHHGYLDPWICSMSHPSELASELASENFSMSILTIQGIPQYKQIYTVTIAEIIYFLYFLQHISAQRQQVLELLLHNYKIDIWECLFPLPLTYDCELSPL